MENLKRYYNQNRKQIWAIIIIIASILIIIQVANYFAGKSSEKKIQNAKNQIEQQKNNVEVNNNNNNKISSYDTTNYNYTNRTNRNTSTDTISQFMNYCNNRELENAYKMLTDNCKEQMFNDIETFERIYYNSTFENRNKEYTIEKWINNTYMVKINESSLALGKVSKENQKIDYITTVNEDNSYKLNINSYIGYKQLNAIKKQNGVTYEVIGKNIYMNHEEYILKITNNQLEDVILDPLNNTRSLYIKDSKGTIYSVYKHELTDDMVTISSGHVKQINLKFYSTYSSNKNIMQIIFEQLKNGYQKEEVKIEL